MGNISEMLRNAEEQIAIVPSGSTVQPVSKILLDMGGEQKIDEGSFATFKIFIDSATGGNGFYPGMNYKDIWDYINSKFSEEELHKLTDYFESIKGSIMAKDEDLELEKRFQQVCREMGWLYCSTHGGKEMVTNLASRLEVEEQYDISVPDRASAALFYYFFIYGDHEQKKWMPTDSQEMKELGISYFEEEVEKKRVLNMQTPDRVLELMDIAKIDKLGSYGDVEYIVNRLKRIAPELVELALELCSKFCINADCYEIRHTWWMIRVVRVCIFKLLEDDTDYINMK